MSGRTQGNGNTMISPRIEQRRIAWWLLICCVLVFGMVVLASAHQAVAIALFGVALYLTHGLTRQASRATG